MNLTRKHQEKSCDRNKMLLPAFSRLTSEKVFALINRPDGQLLFRQICWQMKAAVWMCFAARLPTAWIKVASRFGEKR